MSVCGHPLAGHGCSRTRSLILHSLGAIPQRTDAVSRDTACCLTQAFRVGELRLSQATGTSRGQQSAPMHSSATRPAVVHGEPGPHHTGKTYPAGREVGRIGQPSRQRCVESCTTPRGVALRPSNVSAKPISYQLCTEIDRLTETGSCCAICEIDMKRSGRVTSSGRISLFCVLPVSPCFCPLEGPEL